MKIWTIEVGPPIDSSVLSAYETMQDEFPNHTIYPMPETEYNMFKCGLAETLKLQEYFKSRQSLGADLPDTVNDEEGFYNPFKEIYIADMDTAELLSYMLEVLDTKCRRIDPVDSPPYYLVPLVDGWEKIMPYYLKGSTSYMQRIIGDLRGGI